MLSTQFSVLVVIVIIFPIFSGQFTQTYLWFVLAATGKSDQRVAFFLLLSREGSQPPRSGSGPP